MKITSVLIHHMGPLNTPLKEHFTMIFPATDNWRQPLCFNLLLKHDVVLVCEENRIELQNLSEESYRFLLQYSVDDSVRVSLTPKHQLLTSCGLQWHHKAAGHCGNQTHPCPLPCPNPLSPPTFPLLSPINCFPDAFVESDALSPSPRAPCLPPHHSLSLKGRLQHDKHLLCHLLARGGQVLHKGFLFWCHYSNAATLIFTQHRLAS